jgi:hypothetical protein
MRFIDLNIIIGIFVVEKTFVQIIKNPDNRKAPQYFLE